jgi:arylsulfatase A-like enzyme
VRLDGESCDTKIVMPQLKRITALFLVCTLTLLYLPRARATAYDDHPKLVIILVLDQLRADYLERYRSDFKDNGFNLFLEHGAWFPDCYYDYANTMTAPGHAAIGTGAYTDGNGIGSNSWWNLARNKKRPISSVEDERYVLVGMPSGEKDSPGASPLNLLASTVGDELRLDTNGQSMVFGVSLKDRAAILTAGAAANGAFWIDHRSGRFITSSYYMPQLPAWAQTFDDGGRIAQARQEAGTMINTGSFYKDVGPTAAAVSYELDFAKALITGEDLGKHPSTDMLTISISSTDILGHRVGPDSPQQRALVDAIDLNLGDFFTWLDKNIPGGLDNVWIALTADHGIAPVPAVAAKLGLNAAGINVKKLAADVNYAMNMKFSPGEKIPYLLDDQTLPYLELNPPSFSRAGINEQEAEDAVQKALPAAFANLDKAAEAAAPSPAPEATPPPPQPSSKPNPPAVPPASPSPSAAPTASTSSAPPPTTSSPQAASPSTSTATPTTAPPSAIPSTSAAATSPAPAPPLPHGKLPPVPRLFRSYTRVQMATGLLPETPFGRIIAHSYTPNGGWYVMVIPDAFQLQGSGQSGTNHFTPYSYDRHVPLAFYGAPFAAGTYLGRVQPIDIAATFASLLGVNQPSASVGEVLTRALKPASEVKYPEPAASHHRAATARRRVHHAAPKPTASEKKP